MLVELNNATPLILNISYALELEETRKESGDG